MNIRADMNIVDKGNILAAGDVFLDEILVIHQVKHMIMEKDGEKIEAVVLPDRLKADGSYDKFIKIEDKELYKQIETAVKEATRRAVTKDMGDFSLKVDVRPYDMGNTKAYASITFNDKITIKSIRIYEWEGKLKVSYPNTKFGDMYQNLAGPATLFTRNVIEGQILHVYNQMVREDPARDVPDISEEELPDFLREDAGPKPDKETVKTETESTEKPQKKAGGKKL